MGALPFLLFNVCTAQVIHGTCQIKNTTLTELTCFGPTQLNNVTIQGALNVFGPLTMTKSAINGSIDIKGSLSSTRSTVKGPAIVYGSIAATMTVFNSNVIAYTSDIELHQSQVKGSFSITANDKVPILQLMDQSTISGNVIFSKQAGTVKVSQDSEVAGSISNGATENSHK